jgi:hypothetical protein
VEWKIFSKVNDAQFFYECVCLNDDDFNNKKIALNLKAAEKETSAVMILFFSVN